ncbi:hypothetical protein [Candidatus Similichlamydia laticola]|nr:hypothetical protein [Candidatus Similichlamydia laticola]
MILSRFSTFYQRPQTRMSRVMTQLSLIGLPFLLGKLLLFYVVVAVLFYLLSKFLFKKDDKLKPPQARLVTRAPAPEGPVLQPPQPQGPQPQGPQPQGPVSLQLQPPLIAHLQDGQEQRAVQHKEQRSGSIGSSTSSAKSRTSGFSLFKKKKKK